MLQALAARLGRSGAQDALETSARPGEEDGHAAREPQATKATRPFHVEVAESGEVLFAQAFEPGTFTIGASPDSDIIIPDLPEPEMASVKLETIGAACLVTLTALAPDVSARGRALAEGKPVLFPERARFRLADAYDFDIAFTPPKRPLVVERSALPGILVVAGLMLAALGTTLGGGGAPATGTTIARADAAAGADGSLTLAALPSAADPPVAAPEPVARLVSAEDRLRQSLAASGLAPQLRAVASGARLVIEGDVTREERDRALDVIDGFRAREAVPVELALASDAREADFFAAVVLEPEPFLIAPDGRRFAPSQRLPDGRILVAIDETTIVVERDGMRERILYAP